MKVKSFVPYIHIHLDVANGNAVLGKADLRPSKWWQTHELKSQFYEFPVYSASRYVENFHINNPIIQMERSRFLIHSNTIQ